jgi:prepilin-type N-terminal cleavage/methylation domain-containing protein
MVKFKDKKGFTLIEMMVAVSIFVIVAFIVVSTLLTMSYAYKKAQKMRLLMDNFNFALQSISLGIREGTKYTVNCAGGDCFSFTPINSDSDAYKVCYSLEGEKIRKCEGVGTSCPCSDKGNDLTSPGIRVDKLQFIDIDNYPDSDKHLVKILISGEAGTQPREITSFFIQNTVSQRNNN